ncbi:hypothetical protein RHS01_04566 [Rhizoctonia solani]|uniref:Uncharacterized protein n=1 Tax=Rhizoctonia solani TaxID=456999 RepID=A0A8H7IHH9_9AGAM|nr:hypothetical protein RHS01_04566 [Rhizoctonia solani]
MTLIANPNLRNSAVLFKLKNQQGDTQDQHDELKEKARREIAEALAKVPVWRTTPCRPNQGLRLLYAFIIAVTYTSSFTIWVHSALFARFKDRAALDTYAANDEHRWVIDNVIRPHTDIEETIDYDLEIPDDAW